MIRTKHIAALLLALALPAHAATLVTGAQAPTCLYAGSGTGKSLGCKPDTTACKADLAARVDAKSLKVGPYRCKSDTPVVASVAPVVVPPPVVTPPPVPPDPSWYFVGEQGALVAPAAAMRFRFGAPGRWIERTMSAPFTADAATFGDPAPGLFKQLQTTDASYAAKTVRVMPLGDSIAGFFASALFDQFKAAGYSRVDFVGNEPYKYASAGHDADSNAYGGYKANDLLRAAGTGTVTNGLYLGDERDLVNWMRGLAPDYLLIYIGTNDDPAAYLDTQRARAKIITAARARNAAVRVYVAQLMGTLGNAGYTAMPAWAASISTSASPVKIVDMAAGFDPTTMLLPDKLHPNEAGVAHLTAKWLAAMAPDLGTPTPPAGVVVLDAAAGNSVREGASFVLAAAQTVRYGAGASWATKALPAGTHLCGNALFGDPASGSVKSCSVAPTVVVAPGDPTWTFLAAERKVFSLTINQTVRYGVPGKWVQKDIRAAVPTECVYVDFEGDPAPGLAKTCEIKNGPGIVAPMLMPTIDRTKIPAPQPGESGPRVKWASFNSRTGEPCQMGGPDLLCVLPDSQRPTPDIIGAFREPCTFSHMAFDDPIIYPGKPGVSHLHTFLGNTGANANSTVTSIATTGNSTCAGGTLNRTSYWVPSMIDTLDGRPIAPTGSLIYYKTGYNGVKPADVKPMPTGLRLIAGSSNADSPQRGIGGFSCVGLGDNTSFEHIPKCPAGTELITQVTFPQCWDGKNLDSPDHKSHMAYAQNGCPSTHPVPLSTIAFVVHYVVGPKDDTTRWRLSSDNYPTTKPGGYSSHADWFMGWDAGIIDTLTTRCLNASVDCHAYLLGDGRTLY